MLYSLYSGRIIPSYVRNTSDTDIYNRYIKRKQRMYVAKLISDQRAKGISYESMATVDLKRECQLCEAFISRTTFIYNPIPYTGRHCSENIYELKKFIKCTK